MSATTKRFAEALRAASPRDWVNDEHGHVVIDGDWVDEDIDKIVNVPLNAQRVEPDTLFMCERWMGGESDDGMRVELDRTPVSLIFRLTKPDGTKIIETVNVGDLMTRWANHVAPEEES